MSSSYRGLSRDTVMLVTAGASGIGRTIARAALAQGCRVHVCDVSPEAVRQFQAENPRASATIADVSSPASEVRGHPGRVAAARPAAGSAQPGP